MSHEYFDVFLKVIVASCLIAIVLYLAMINDTLLKILAVMK